MIGTTMLLALGAALMQPGLTAGGPPPARMDGLGWMSGHWRTRGPVPASGPSWTEEIWTSPEGGTMLGLSRRHSAFQIREFEFMRIARDAEGGASLHASPGGGPSVAFRLVRATADEGVFENPAHDYPQRIAYRRDGESLVATVSLIDGSRALSWRFERFGGDAD